jgi:hypothetical protein
MTAVSSPSIDPPNDANYTYAPAAPVVTDRASLEIQNAYLPPLLLPIVLVILFLLVDFLAAPLMYRGSGSPYDWSTAVILVCIALIGAQSGVLSAWLVWGSGPFLWRLLIHWGIAAVCCWIWIAGLATVARGTELIDGHCVAALSLAIVAAAIQAPLWLARQMFAWRLVRHGATKTIAPERPSTIGNLMLGISIAAVALAFARLVPTGVKSSELVLMWSFVAGWSAAIGALGVLPMAACLLWPTSIGSGLIWGAAYALLIIAGTLSFILTASVLERQIVPLEVLVGMTILLASLFSGLAMSALAARGLGYRLKLGKASRQPNKPA